MVPLQVVTMGDRATEVFEQMQRDGNYSEGYFVHGLSVALAEALAEWTHNLIKGELGLQEGRGRRYSWGYPACPDLEEQAKLLKVLPSEKTIGVKLTEGMCCCLSNRQPLSCAPPAAKYYTPPAHKGPCQETLTPEPEEVDEGRNYVEPEPEPVQEVSV